MASSLRILPANITQNTLVSLLFVRGVCYLLLRKGAVGSTSSKTVCRGVWNVFPHLYDTAAACACSQHTTSHAHVSSDETQQRI